MAAIEAVLKVGRIIRRIFTEPERVVRAIDGGLQMTQHNVHPLELGMLDTARPKP